MTDATLKRRQGYIPQAEAIIKEITDEFNAWLQTRKFAPTVKALKARLKEVQAAELENVRKKTPDFSEATATAMSDKIIQKITNQVAHHLRHANGETEESIALISTIFQLDQHNV